MAKSKKDITAQTKAAAPIKTKRGSAKPSLKTLHTIVERLRQQSHSPSPKC